MNATPEHPDPTAPSAAETPSAGSAGPTDERLFARFREGGDRDAFAELVRRHHGPVSAFLRRRVGDPHRAEELVQETFLAAFSRAETFEPGRPFKPWLYAIAVNSARAAGRRAARDPVAPAADLSGPASGPAGDSGDGPRPPDWADPADPAPGPDALAQSGELAAAVREAVSSLPEAQAEVVLLSQYQGLSYPEIAEATGRPLGTIKSLMHYAVKALRLKLEAVRRRLEEAEG
jgi:RNA polymerase sigma-70 factor (ECF subfamily)